MPCSRAHTIRRTSRRLYQYASSHPAVCSCRNCSRQTSLTSRGTRRQCGAHIRYSVRTVQPSASHVRTSRYRVGCGALMIPPRPNVALGGGGTVTVDSAWHVWTSIACTS